MPIVIVYWAVEPPLIRLTFCFASSPIDEPRSLLRAAQPSTGPPSLAPQVVYAVGERCAKPDIFTNTILPLLESMQYSVDTQRGALRARIALVAQRWQTAGYAFRGAWCRVHQRHWRSCAFGIAPTSPLNSIRKASRRLCKASNRAEGNGSNIALAFAAIAEVVCLVLYLYLSVSQWRPARDQHDSIAAANSEESRAGDSTSVEREGAPTVDFRAPTADGGGQQLLAVSALASNPTPEPSSPLHGILLAIVIGCNILIRYLNRPAPQNPELSLPSAARLAHVESMCRQLSSSLEQSQRQLDKLQIRARIVSADVRTPLREVQRESANHAALLAQLAQAQQKLADDVLLTQRLLAAMQDISGRQFTVTSDAIKQVRADVARLAPPLGSALATSSALPADGAGANSAPTRLAAPTTAPARTALRPSTSRVNGRVAVVAPHSLSSTLAATMENTNTTASSATSVARVGNRAREALNGTAGINDANDMVSRPVAQVVDPGPYQVPSLAASNGPPLRPA